MTPHTTTGDQNPDEKPQKWYMDHCGNMNPYFTLHLKHSLY